MNLEELFRVQKPMRDSPSWMTENFLRVRILHGMTARQVDALRDAESDAHMNSPSTW